MLYYKKGEAMARGTTKQEDNSPDSANHTGELTLKNKKSDILEALNAALLREKKLKENRYNPAEEEKKTQTAKLVEETRQNVSLNIFSDELNLKFEKLEKAIQAEEKKLSDLYGIEGEMNELVTIIAAKEEVLAKLEAEKTARLQELSMQIVALEEEYTEKARILELDRKREAEEYEYHKKRTREQENDQWDSIKAEREKNISEQETKTLALLKEAEAKSEHLAELEKQVADVPAALKKEYIRGREEAMKEIERENKFTTELLKKDYQGKIDRQTDIIESLKNELERSNTEKDAALSKLDQAYSEIRELATRTVEATGGVRIIGSDNKE